MSELDKKIKKHFESNMLDGDEVQKGQMIASTAVLEYLQEYIPELIKDTCEKVIPPEMSIEDNDDQFLFKTGYNAALKVVKYDLKKELDDEF